MRCPRCGTQMAEQRGTHHKKKKWVCPRCRKVRMQSAHKLGRASDRLR